MAASTPTCGICDLRHLHNPSVVWCSECDEGLCRDCKEHHGLVKASRNHKTIPIDEYMKLPSDIINIKDHCEQHHEKFQTFCEKHNCPCCRMCMVQDHDGCKKIPLENVVHNVKTSNSFVETELLIDEILETINAIYKDRRSNVDSFAQQKKIIEQKIRETREKVIDHLDKLEEALKKDIATAETSIIDKTNKITAALDKQKEEVVGYQKTLINIKKYASDLQTFCVLNQIKDNINIKDQFLHSLVESGHLNRNHVSFKTNSMIDDVIVSIQQFGEVIMESRPSKIRFARSKNKQAQMVVVTIPTKSVDTIRVTHQQKINTKLSNVRGCFLLPNDTMAFCCYKKNVVRIINKDGSKLSDINTGTHTFDMVYIEDTNSIAVTSGGMLSNQRITMIANDSKQIQKSIPVESLNYSITARNGTLYFCAPYKGLCVFNLDDNSERKVVTCPMSLDAYVTTFNDKLYFTNSNNNTVTCCDLQGDIQWDFKDEGILRSPYGIDVDKHGNIYVVGNYHSNVLIISFDGKQCRQLSSPTDGLNYPAVLNIDKTRGKLLVTNQTNEARLFNISY